MALGFAARQCSALMREGEELLPADEQVGDDAGRAAVETCVRRLLAISGGSRAHPPAHLIEPEPQPLNVTGHRLRIEATGRIPLTRAQPLRADVPGRYFDQEHPCDQALPRRSLFPRRQDQGAWWMGGAQRVVGLQASA